MRTYIPKKPYLDTDMTKAARSHRFREWMALRSLPFLSKEQARRGIKLKMLVRRDNKFAFENERLLNNSEAGHSSAEFTYYFLLGQIFAWSIVLIFQELQF